MAKGQIKQKQSTINKSQFEGMCFVQCTKEEICAILGVSDITLTRWCKNTYDDNFEGVYKKYMSIIILNSSLLSLFFISIIFSIG